MLNTHWRHTGYSLKSYWISTEVLLDTHWSHTEYSLNTHYKVIPKAHRIFTSVTHWILCLTHTSAKYTPSFITRSHLSIIPPSHSAIPQSYFPTTLYSPITSWSHISSPCRSHTEILIRGISRFSRGHICSFSLTLNCHSPDEGPRER